MAIIFPKINSGLLVSDLAFLQEGYEYGINDTGPFQRFSRRGRNADVQSWAATLANAGWNVRVVRERVASGTGSGDTGYNPSTADYGISRIEAEAGWPFPYVYGTETPENIVEMDPQDEQKNLLEADFPNGQIAPFSDTYSVLPTSKAVADMVASGNNFDWLDSINRAFSSNVGALGYYFDDGTNTPDANNTLQSPIHLPSADYASAKSFYYLLKKGVDAFPIEASVIRHSMVTSSQYAVQASYNNMQRIISSASMIAIEGIDDQLLFNIPTEPDPTQFVEVPGDLQYGWRKVRPAITRLNRMKWRIQQNYQFGLWAIKLYGNVL